MPDFTCTLDSLHVVVDPEQMRMRRCDNLGAFVGLVLRKASQPSSAVGVHLTVPRSDKLRALSDDTWCPVVEDALYIPLKKAAA